MYAAATGLRHTPAQRQIFEDWRGTPYRDVAAAVAKLPRGDVYFTSNWHDRVSLYLGYGPDSLKPDGPRRSARLPSGQIAELKLLELDGSRWPIHVTDAYVLHDFEVSLRRPLDWQSVDRLLSGSTLYYAPPQADHRRWVVHLEAERFDLVVADQGGALSTIQGWASYSQSYYSVGKAAIARLAGARMTTPIPLLSEGDYQITVRVYDYGNGGENRIVIWIGGATPEIAWSGTTAGVRDVIVPISTSESGGRLTVDVLSNGQGFVIIDSIDIGPSTQTVP